MKKVLFVINTLGIGGAERSLLELLDSLDSADCAIDLYVLLGRGQLISRVPEHVRLLNGKVDGGSIQDSPGRWALARMVAASFFRNGSWAGKLGSVLRALPSMLRNRRFQPDKLFWRVAADGAVRLEDRYDVAVAWIEGGASYFVADHVQAEIPLSYLRFHGSRRPYRL